MARVTSPAYFVFEGDLGSNLPARPTLDQMGGAAFVNCVAPDQAPIPDEEPLAEDFNQISLVAWAASKMMPALIVGCDGASSPVLTSVVAVNRNISTNAPTNPDISVTHSATGHYVVQVYANATSPSAKLPPMTWGPMANANKSGKAAASAAWNSAGKYDVYTHDNTGAIDAAFTLSISGY
jgi:hypothetical protein